MKVTALGNLNTAINYGETFGLGATMEIVDERTGMLLATVDQGKTERTVGSVRREVL
ncbi:MAG: hypothetical protein K0S14_1425 [Thermomicrobiales bacterium]|nr:hypothetical protein [Thermomicrobiales bacterium]